MKATSAATKPKSTPARPPPGHDRTSAFQKYASDSHQKSLGKAAETPTKAFRVLKPPSLASQTPTKERTVPAGVPQSAGVVYSPQHSETPVRTRIRPADIFAKELASEDKVFSPFKTLARPVLRIDDPGSRGESPLKKLPAPNFELAAKNVSKMTFMTSLDIPIAGVTEDESPSGVSLEMHRGLLVSPEKGSKKRARFQRYVTSHVLCVHLS